MRNQTILVDINKETCKILKYKQYDNNNILQIIVEENYKKINLNEYVGFAFFELPSGLIIKKECEIEDNVITIIIDNNILSEDGKVLLDLTLSDGEDTFTLFRINLVIEETIDRDEAIIIEAGWDIVAEIAKFDKAEEQRVANEERRVDYESVRIANESDRQNEEMKRIANENVRVAKENERLRKEIERVNAEEQRIENEEQRRTEENERLINEQGRVEAENIRAEFYEGFNDRLNEVDSQLAHIENKMNVNINDFKEYVNTIDGIEDWTNAIQKAIDYVYSNGGGVVELNTYEYNITKPIILNSDSHNSVELRGNGVTATKILKYNNNRFINNEYSNIDSIIILSSNTDNIGYHKINNLSLLGNWFWSEQGNHLHVEYGIYCNRNICYVDINNIHVEANKGIVFDDHLWQSIIRNFRLHTWTRGIYLGGHGSTSNLIEKGYVMNCRGENAIAYQFTGNYSSCNSLAADNCGGIIYRFWKADWVANGLGCEVMGNCDTVVNVETLSNVVLNSPTLFVPTKENSVVFNCYSDANLIVNGGSIGEKLSPRINNKCRLIELGWGYSNLKLNNVKIYDTFELNCKKVDDEQANAFINDVNVFSINKSINGLLSWEESSRSDEFTTYYTTIDLPSYAKWSRLSDELCFEVSKSAIPIYSAKNKPIYFSNISSNKSSDINELFLTLPNSMIKNVEELKTFLNDYPITLTIKSLEG